MTTKKFHIEEIRTTIDLIVTKIDGLNFPDSCNEDQLIARENVRKLREKLVTINSNLDVLSGTPSPLEAYDYFNAHLSGAHAALMSLVKNTNDLVKNSSHSFPDIDPFKDRIGTVTGDFGKISEGQVRVGVYKDNLRRALLSLTDPIKSMSPDFNGLSSSLERDVAVEQMPNIPLSEKITDSANGIAEAIEKLQRRFPDKEHEYIPALRSATEELVSAARQAKNCRIPIANSPETLAEVISRIKAAEKRVLDLSKQHEQRIPALETEIEELWKRNDNSLTCVYNQKAAELAALTVPKESVRSLLQAVCGIGNTVTPTSSLSHGRTA